jgi:hypothetical protein
MHLKPRLVPHALATLLLLGVGGVHAEAGERVRPLALLKLKLLVFLPVAGFGGRRVLA